MAGTVVVDAVKSSTTGAPTFQNTSGTEIGTLCRAWVNFVGSSASIQGSFNVSSITRNTTGDYTLNFTNAMPDANYSPIAICSGVGNDIKFNIYSTANNSAPVLMTASQVRLRAWTGTDAYTNCVAVFR